MLQASGFFVSPNRRKRTLRPNSCGVGYTDEVKFRILGSFGGDSPACRMTSFLVDGTVAIDAGAITRALHIEEQRRIRHVVITHTHSDHTATLPFLIENIFGADDEAVSIYSTRRVLANVRRHLFNNDTWPDFSRIPNHLYPSVRFVEIRAGEPFVISGLEHGDLEITPIPVNHIVPTIGLFLRQDGTSVAFSSDTGPTEAFWKRAGSTRDLVALITECSFPSRLQAVADVSLHLTPKTLAIELAKLHTDASIYLYHLKPPYVDEIRDELKRTSLSHPVEELEQDRTYSF